MKPHKIYADNIDGATLDQFYDAMKQDYVVQGALMADAHLGYAMPIGGVVATEGVVVPAWVGYDIGCGMCALPLRIKGEIIRRHAEEIYQKIREEVPVGFSHRDTPVKWREYGRYKGTEVADNIMNENDGKGFRQIGTLGGGNHFIEIGVDHDDVPWIIVHSGSRNVGHSIATHYMKLASGTDKAKEGHYGLDVTTQEGQDYLRDQAFACQFALQNRLLLVHEVTKIIQPFFRRPTPVGVQEELINRNHNHVELKNGLYIHRKGATHAEKGMMGVIPGNMRDGSFIVRGLGNPESLCSSSHGAGRVLGRKEAKRQVNVDDFKQTMEGIVCNADATTVDESPFAYKDIFEVMDAQKELVETVYHVRPILNVKG